MKLEYKGFSGENISRELKEIDVKGLILHSTPDRNIEGIKENGLKINMPKTKAILDSKAIFCTIPSDTPSTDDLFRYYDDWSIVVIDTNLIPNHKWYVDCFGEMDTSNNGKQAYHDIRRNSSNCNYKNSKITKEMLKNAQITKSDFTANITWKCPHCGAENHTIFSINPYRIPAEDLPDDICTTCKEHSTLSFDE